MAYSQQPVTPKQAKADQLRKERGSDGALRSQPSTSSATGDCAHDEEGFFAFRDWVGQGSIGRFVRNVFAASEEADERATLERVVLANRAAPHRVFVFERAAHIFHRRRAIKSDMHFVADFGESPEVMRKNNSNHLSVCTSTDRTAGRSRTIGFHESPLSADA